MLEKTYFFIKPSEFKRLGNIDIDGNVEEIQCPDFHMPNEKENVLVFEAYYDDYYRSGLRDFEPYVKLFGTKKKFKLEIFKPRGKNQPRCLNIYSEELGLYMERSIPIHEVEKTGLQASGLLMYIQENEEDKLRYAYEIREMLETAQAFKHIYDNCVCGPSNYIKSSANKAYKRAKHLRYDDAK